ncbi:MAG: hypothetical protein WC678_01000 [Parcubacteria group bacterium]|jgi:hypothetical protein
MIKNFSPEQKLPDIIPDKTEQEELSRGFNNAKIFLARFEINNLSNIEAVKLRMIVKQCITENKETNEKISTLEEKINELKEGDENTSAILKKQKNILIHHLFSIAKESASRWLWELYGIHIDHIPYNHIAIDKTTGENFNFFISPYEIDKGDNRLERKIDKIKEDGHKSSWEIKYDKKFIEYLKILREKSHLPAGL